MTTKKIKKNDHSLTDAADSLPSHWYYDSAHHQKEMASVWGNSWIYACTAQSLAEKGAYQTLRIGKQNIIIVRDAQLKLNAYYNSCRHRGSMLCQQQHGQLKTNFLVCPYHQWSYALSDGSLNRTTSFKQPKGFNPKEYGLLRVALKCWRGLVFINLNPDVVWQHNEVFQNYDSVLDDFPLEEMVLGHSWRKKVKCNWKIYWENFSECLHCPNIHPELSQLVPVYSRRLADIKDVPNWQQLLSNNHPKYQGGLKEGAQTWSEDGSAQECAIASVAENPLFKAQSYSSTWPSMFLGGYLDHIRIVRLVPIDHQTTELTAHWLFEKTTLSNKKYRQQNVTDFAKLVMKQDARACELNQRGLYNRDYKKGVIMPEEYTIKAFHDWLKTQLKH